VKPKAKMTEEAPAVAAGAPTVEERNLKLDAICPDGAYMVRLALDSETVDEYTEALQEGAQFPPVDVFDLGNGKLPVLVDGWHRYKAASNCGFAKIATRIHRGTREDALLFALKANQTHGLKRSNADKRRAVEVALGVWPAMSSRALALLCGVDHKTVDEMRGSTGEVRQLNRTGSDGKTRVLPARGASSADNNRADSAKDAAEESDGDRETPDAAKDRAREEWQDWSAFEDAAVAARDAIGLLEGAHVANKRREMAHAVCGKLAARCKALAARFADDD